MSNPKRLTVWLPVIIGVSVVAGIFIGGIFSGKNYLADSDRKLNTILNLIQQEYVDTVDIDELVENSIPKILTNLAPHSGQKFGFGIRLSNVKPQVAKYKALPPPW